MSEAKEAQGRKWNAWAMAWCCAFVLSGVLNGSLIKENRDLHKENTKLVSQLTTAEGKVAATQIAAVDDKKQVVTDAVRLYCQP